MSVKIRDRVVGVEKVQGRKLRPHPKNWKEHGRGQRDMWRGVRDEIGVAGALVGRRVKGGVIEVLDGHMRSEEEPDFEWTVLLVDLNDEEAEKFLATHDPLGAASEARKKLLDELLAGVKTENADVRRLLADMQPSARELESEGEAKADGKPTELEDRMALQPHEHYDYLVVLARTTQEWNVLLDRLGMKPEKRRGGMGTAHAIRAQALLDVIGTNDAKRARGK